VEYASENKANVEDLLLRETEFAFWEAVYSEELHKQMIEYEKAIDDLAIVIRDKVETQIISRNDLLLVEVRQNEAELFRLMAKNQLDMARMELNRVIGLPLDSIYRLEGDLAAFQLMDLDYELDSVLLNRPDLAAHSKQVEIQYSNADLVRSGYLPSIYVGIIPSWGAPNTNIGSTDPNYNTSFMAGMRFPIIRWGKKRQEVGRELLRAEAANYQLTELQDEVKLDINSSRYQLAESIRRIELTRESLNKAEENLQIMTDRYLEGLTSILEVLDAQVYWHRSYKDMLDAQLYYKRAFAYHKFSIGEI
jgi:outer membrane protein TolC